MPNYHKLKVTQTYYLMDSVAQIPEMVLMKLKQDICAPLAALEKLFPGTVTVFVGFFVPQLHMVTELTSLFLAVCQLGIFPVPKVLLLSLALVFAHHRKQLCQGESFLLHTSATSTSTLLSCFSFTPCLSLIPAREIAHLLRDL